MKMHFLSGGRVRMRKATFIPDTDRSEMIAWLGNVKDKSPRLGPVWLVHGEAAVQDEFRDTLAARGYFVECPEPHTRHIF